MGLNHERARSGKCLLAVTPAGCQFRLTWWNDSDYGDPTDDPSREIILVTARSSDTLTVTRGQEGTSAVNHNTAGKTYRLALYFTKAWVDELNAQINASTGAINNVVDCASDASCDAVIGTIGSAVKTLRVSRTEAIANNLTIPANITVEFTGAGVMAIAAGVVVTFQSPEQIKAPVRSQIFSFVSPGTGAIAFVKPGLLPITWCGAIAGDGVDDAPAFQKCHQGFDGGSVADATLEIPAGTYTWNTQVNSGLAGLVIRMVGATLDGSGLVGTGDTGVHGTLNTLSVFRLTGQRQRVVGGRITCTNTVNTNKNCVGVLLSGASNARVSSIQIDGAYACVWAGGNTVDLTLFRVDLSGCAYPFYGGFAASPTNPELTHLELLDVRAHNSTVGAGAILESHVYDVQILGGYYYANAGEGIHIETGGERVAIIGANIYGNTGTGLRVRYWGNSGTTAGKWGFGRRLQISDLTLRNNGGDNLSVQLDDYSAFASVGGVEEVKIAGNWSEGAGGDGYDIGCVRCIVADNGAYRNTGNGFLFRSLAHATIGNNQSWDNGTTTVRKTGYLFLTAATTGGTPPDSTGVAFSGNIAGDTRTGTARTQTYGFDLTKVSNSTFFGNRGNNHFTAEWTGTGGSGNSFLQNVGTVDGTNTIGAPIIKHLFGSKTFDPPSTANNSQWNTTVTVAGAALGDAALCGFSTAMPISWLFRGHVTAADTVTCSADNYTGATVDLASGTLIAEVFKH